MRFASSRAICHGISRHWQLCETDAGKNPKEIGAITSGVWGRELASAVLGGHRQFAADNFQLAAW